MLSLIAYANALPNSFHFDDFEGIGENASLRDLRNIPSYFFYRPGYFSPYRTRRSDDRARLGLA